MRYIQMLLGKPVVGLKGKEIGDLVDIVFDEKNVKLTEIVVDEGLFKGKTNFPIEQIDEFREESIILNITPSLKIHGMAVYDVDNNLVGSVKEIEYD